jgi:hypothetical protein
MMLLRRLKLEQALGVQRAAASTAAAASVAAAGGPGAAHPARSGRLDAGDHVQDPVHAAKLQAIMDTPLEIAASADAASPSERQVRRPPPPRPPCSPRRQPRRTLPPG